MTSRPGQRMAGGSHASMRASPADLDRVIEVLQRSFAEGRLDRDELDERLGQALISRFFADLMALVADLPPGPSEMFGPSTPPYGWSRRHRIAVAAHLLVGLVVLFAAIGAMLAV
jgi:hypothetical protein